MNKKIYIAPAVCDIDFVEEGMIATSVGVHEENIGEEFSNEKEPNLWGDQSIWK